MKRYSLFPFTLLLICLVSVSASGKTATVVSWNIEGFAAIQPPKPKTIAKAIDKLSPDIVVLIEVNPDSVATDIKNELTGYSVLIVPQSASQNIAILFKDSLSVTHPRLIEGSDDGNNALRKALAADVRIGEFDFILIGVHMKASRPDSSLGNQDPHEVRNREARAIAEFIRVETSGDEKDVLVVGDYNMIPGEDNPNFRSMSPGSGADEYLRYISTESLAGQVSHISSCTGGTAKGNLLDGFAISKKFTTEYVESSMIIIKANDGIFASSTPLTCAKYKSTFSDHFPLMAKFRTNNDDD
jgi:hypothetical protein